MIILLGFLAACAVTTVLAWALNRSALRRLPTPQQFDLYRDLGREHFRYIHRLFAPEDFDFLESLGIGRALLPRLRRERRRILRLLLADLRREFEALLAVGALLLVSPTAKDESYAALLGREKLRFYSIYSALRLLSFWPGVLPMRLDPAPLWHQIKALRHSIRMLMGSLTPNDLQQLRQTLSQ